MANPFTYNRPLPPEEMIARDDQVRRLLEWSFEGEHARLVAPRQYGKTTLLRRVHAEASEGGLVGVYVDFFGVLTLADVAERIERAYSEQLSGDLARWFVGVQRMLGATARLGGGAVPASVEITTTAPQASAPLLDRLALPRRLHEKHGRRALVIFDEFQDVLATHDRADAVIRSEIQHHGDAASYIFAGSHVGMMRELFTDRRRAFYNQARPLELPALPDGETADELAARFADSGKEMTADVLMALLSAAGGHPQRTMWLAHALWELTPAKSAATAELWLTAYDEVMRDAGPMLRAVWSSSTPGQQRALATIAENRAALYGTDRPHGGGRGGAVRKAVDDLLARGEIVAARGSRTGYRLVDPLLAAWVVAGRHGQ